MTSMPHSRQRPYIQAPDPHKVPWVGAQSRFLETPDERRGVPEGSDLFPSVSLAAVLGLIFILVVPVLLPTAGSLGRHAISINGRLVQLHPLLSHLPLATQWSLEKSLQGNKENVVTVIATASDAAQTLICFSTNVISLLSSQGQTQNVTKRIQNYETSMSWSSSSKRLSGVFFTSVIIQRKRQSPYGIILGPESITTENGPQWQMVLTLPQVENEVTTHKEASDIAAELLLLLNRTGRVPEMFRKGESMGKSLPVLHIPPDPYLESGFVC